MDYTSKHPYKPFVPEGATKLIIGTMPPCRFCHKDQANLLKDDVDFYYGSRDNYFWELVSDAVGTELHFENTEEAVDERKVLLARLHMGITDMVKQCTHKDGRSDDDSLENIQFNDIATLLYEHPKIDTLIYTSNKVASMVNNVSDKKYHEKWDKTRKNGIVLINHKVYSVHILYSPSPSALRNISKETRAKCYKEIFKID